MYFRQKAPLVDDQFFKHSLAEADFETAEAAFDSVQKLDPYRLDDVDIYSNMLYVMPKLGKLAQLAKEYCEIDRNRAETCCLIGQSATRYSSPCG